MTKYIKSITNLGYLLMVLCGGLFLSSCDKDESSGVRTSNTPPTIERVRLTDPSTKDSSLQQSTLGSTIAIIGTNLASARTVSFNGYALNVNPAYATDNSIVITIHDSVPTIATNPNVPDELKVVTAGGEATYKFTVLPPRPEILQIGNEFAKPGETVTIYGRYFYFVDTVFFGSRAVTTGISANGTSLTVTIPTGVDLTQGDLRVRSKSGLSATGAKTKFYNPARTLMLIDWDSNQKFGWGLNTATAIKSSFPGITPIDGKFAVIDQNVPGNWGWNNDKVIHMQDFSDANKLFFPVPSGFDPEAAIANYEIKMEVASTLPVGALMLQAWQSNPNVGNIEKNIQLSDFVKSADGKWYTVAVNLGDVVSSTGKLTKYKDLYNATGVSEFRLLVINSTTADIPAKLAFDNIRVEKTK
jgi:hypothetical protein